MKKGNKKPAYKRPPTIFNLLRNVKDNYSQGERTGIYSIPLQNLDNGTEELYIGATCRNVKKRISEHKRDVKNASFTTALVKRAYEGNVRMKWEESKVTKQVVNTHELFIVEGIQIYKGKINTVDLNDRQVDSLEKPWRYALNGNTH